MDLPRLLNTIENDIVRMNALASIDDVKVLETAGPGGPAGVAASAAAGAGADRLSEVGIDKVFEGLAQHVTELTARVTAGQLDLGDRDRAQALLSRVSAAVVDVFDRRAIPEDFDMHPEAWLPNWERVMNYLREDNPITPEWVSGIPFWELKLLFRFHMESFDRLAVCAVLNADQARNIGYIAVNEFAELSVDAFKALPRDVLLRIPDHFLPPSHMAARLELLSSVQIREMTYLPHELYPSIMDQLDLSELTTAQLLTLRDPLPQDRAAANNLLEHLAFYAHKLTREQIATLSFDRRFSLSLSADEVQRMTPEMFSRVPELTPQAWQGVSADLLRHASKELLERCPPIMDQLRLAADTGSVSTIDDQQLRDCPIQLIPEDVLARLPTLLALRLLHAQPTYWNSLVEARVKGINIEQFENQSPFSLLCLALSANSRPIWNQLKREQLHAVERILFERYRLSDLDVMQLPEVLQNLPTIFIMDYIKSLSEEQLHRALERTRTTLPSSPIERALLMRHPELRQEMIDRLDSSEAAQQRWVFAMMTPDELETFYTSGKADFRFEAIQWMSPERQQLCYDLIVQKCASIDVDAAREKVSDLRRRLETAPMKVLDVQIEQLNQTLFDAQRDIAALYKLSSILRKPFLFQHQYDAVYRLRTLDLDRITREIELRRVAEDLSTRKAQELAPAAAASAVRRSGVTRSLSAEDLLPVFREHLLGGFNEEQLRIIADRLVDTIRDCHDPASTNYLEENESLRIPHLVFPEFLDKLAQRDLERLLATPAATPAEAAAIEDKALKFLQSCAERCQVPFSFFCVIERTADSISISLQCHHPAFAIAKTLSKEVFKAQQFVVPMHSGLFVEGSEIRCHSKVLSRVFSAGLSHDDRKALAHAIRLQARISADATKAGRESGFPEAAERLGTMPGFAGKRWESVQEFAGPTLSFLTSDLERRVPMDVSGKATRLITTREIIDLFLEASNIIRQQFHRRFIAHRDVKGANLLVSVSGLLQPPKIKVIDIALSQSFGLSIHSMGRDYAVWDMPGRDGWALPTTDVYGLVLSVAAQFLMPSDIYDPQLPLRIASASEADLRIITTKWMVDRLNWQLTKALSEKSKARLAPDPTLLREIQQACHALHAKLNAAEDLEEVLSEIQADVNDLVQKIGPHYFTRLVADRWMAELPLMGATAEYLVVAMSQSVALGEFISSNLNIQDVLRKKGPTDDKRKVIAEINARFPALTIRSFQAFCRRLSGLAH